MTLIHSLAPAASRPVATILTLKGAAQDTGRERTKVRTDMVSCSLGQYTLQG